MKIYKGSIDIGDRKFGLVKFSFNIEEDKELIENFKQQGKELVKNLNFGLARDISRSKNDMRVLSNAIAGEVSEYCCRYWIKQTALASDIKLNLHKTDIDERKNQIDIVIEYENSDCKTAEVRSSFPYAGLTKAIRKNFDIIGWYQNEIKIKEERKDYYLRVLFPFAVDDFFSKLEKNFDVFICGGASRKLLEESPYANYKPFVPSDEIVQNNNTPTNYRVIEPIINGYDTDEITELIMQGVQERCS